jgi:hypothetical protein
MIKDAAFQVSFLFINSEDLNLDSESYIQNNTLIVGLYICALSNYRINVLNNGRIDCCNLSSSYIQIITLEMVLSSNSLYKILAESIIFIMVVVFLITILIIVTYIIIFLLSYRSKWNVQFFEIYYNTFQVFLVIFIEFYKYT